MDKLHEGELASVWESALRHVLDGLVPDGGMRTEVKKRPQGASFEFSAIVGTKPEHYTRSFLLEESVVMRGDIDELEVHMKDWTRRVKNDLTEGVKKGEISFPWAGDEWNPAETPPGKPAELDPEVPGVDVMQKPEKLDGPPQGLIDIFEDTNGPGGEDTDDDDESGTTVADILTS